MSENKYDDGGSVTLVSDFSYDQIDRDLGFAPAERDLDDACECQRRIWAWVYQPPCKDLDGFNCRCIVASWIFVPQLRSESMTYIAGRFGKKKQSLGRWVSDFKTAFPEVSKHLQHLRHDD
jgi:hypothetical protein